MFTIPVGDLLSSYDGDSKTFSFEGPIFDGYYEDLTFVEPLSFDLQIMGIGDGIHASFSDLRSVVEYEKKRIKIHIPSFERDWKMHPSPEDADDIGAINTKNMTIDLRDVIREEIIMECFSHNL